MEKNLMNDFKISYDHEEDILYLGLEGQEEEVVELSPGIHAELDQAGRLIGIEVFKASHRFKDIIKRMEEKLQAQAA
jgi:uncharacterized protein YuzE